MADIEHIPEEDQDKKDLEDNKPQDLVILAGIINTGTANEKKLARILRRILRRQ